jgi:integrase
MRRILIDRPRHKQTHKAGGGRRRLDLGDNEPALAEANDDRLLALDEALRQLELEGPRKAQLVRLRFFAGLTAEQAAAAMGRLHLHRREGRMERGKWDVARGPVFVDSRGGWLRKWNVYRRSFLPLVKAAKLPAARFHDLRHTHAKLLLCNGVNIKAVAARLGHSSPTITLSTYSHWMREMEEQVIGAVGRLMHGGPIVPRRRP